MWCAQPDMWFKNGWVVGRPVLKLVDVCLCVCVCKAMQRKVMSCNYGSMKYRVIHLHLFTDAHSWALGFLTVTRDPAGVCHTCGSERFTK